MLELRCDHKLHAKLDEDIVEIRCNSRWCGAVSGVVVLHRFNLHGKLVGTVKYKSPTRKDRA